MTSPSFRHAIPHPGRAVLFNVPALAMLLAFGGCGGDDPLAPASGPVAETSVPQADEASAPVTQPVVANAALAGTSQRVVFASRLKGSFDIFKMDPQGNNRVQLTSFGGDESEPAWSYNNTTVAMVRMRTDSANVKRSDIFLMNADGTGKRWARSQPSSFPMGYPSWSPDGKQLVLCVLFGGKPYLATMEVATGNMAFVMAEGHLLQGWYPKFDAAGKSIVYVGYTFGTLDQATPGGDHIYLVSSAKMIGRLSFSPDGTKIAFSQAIGVNYNNEIYTLDLATKATKRLTYSSAFDAMPTWSPDGSKIAFVSTRSSAKTQIFTMNASTGGGVTQITHTDTDETQPAWSH